MSELANEVGLVIFFENKKEFILSHGLHDGSDDFSVITKDMINRKILEQIYICNI